MVIHRLSFFIGQLNVLAYHCIVYYYFFFTGQLNVLAYYTAARWTSSASLLLVFPHAREILLPMLSIDSNRKLNAVQFLEHVRIPRQNLINLVRTMPSWRPFTKLFIFGSQWQYCLPNQVSHL